MDGTKKYGSYSNKRWLLVRNGEWRLFFDCWRVVAMRFPLLIDRKLLIERRLSHRCNNQIAISVLFTCTKRVQHSSVQSGRVQRNALYMSFVFVNRCKACAKAFTCKIWCNLYVWKKYDLFDSRMKLVVCFHKFHMRHF